MRTIKFRGQCIGSKKWVYGSIITSDDGAQIHVAYNELYAVDPETVGQFTGLLDKNNTEIYEGDLLGRVVEGVKYCTNEVAHNNCGLFAKSLIAGVDFFFEITTVLDKYEIVGNIHDNPELIK